jgi:hypothetical protein
MQILARDPQPDGADAGLLSQRPESNRVRSAW